MKSCMKGGAVQLLVTVWMSGSSKRLKNLSPFLCERLSLVLVCLGTSLIAAVIRGSVESGSLDWSPWSEGVGEHWDSKEAPPLTCLACLNYQQFPTSFVIQVMMAGARSFIHQGMNKRAKNWI